MAVTQTQVLPAPFIEAAGKTFLGDLATATGKYEAADLSKVFGPQFVAQMDPLQLEAIKQATAGIDTTLQEYDIQSQKGMQGIADQAVRAGAFGSAREGVQRAEYQQASDRNRAALQAQLLQQGFGQAQQAAAQQYAQQMGLATGQQGLLGRQVSGLASLGANVQAQKQAELQAQQQLAQQQLMQPLTGTQAYGAGVTSMIAGYPGQSKQVMTPTPSGTQTALSTASTLAGIYGALR